MRLLAVQENGYGVGLAEDRFLSDVEATMMATTDTMDAKQDAVVEEGSVISNLPLLFANGYPTSLEKITLAQLERFVTFMVQCSLGRDTQDLITEPQWWPKEVKFSNPLTRPKRSTESWMANLKKLVFRCYTYHRSEYLLRFCSYLARYPHEELEYVHNWDSTTSLYHKSTGKLLVTFRNENMNYDKRNESSTRKKLLARNGSSGSNKPSQLHSLIMVEPPSDDIYLCDNCDAELVGYELMKEHERVCCEPEQASGNSRPTTPDLSALKPELQQDQFLEYFYLRSAKAPTSSHATDQITGDKLAGEVKRTSRRVRNTVNFMRCQTIPFSSPAGIILAKKSKMMTEETLMERLERIERHAIAPVLNEESRVKWMAAGEADRDKWIVTHKANKEKPVNEYVHEYKFVNSVKKKPMLSIQSQLLYIVCRPVYVLLTRLTQEQLDELKRNPSKYRSPIRKISVNDNELARKTSRLKRTRLMPSKRKAPGDESDTRERTDAHERHVTSLLEGSQTLDRATLDYESRLDRANDSVSEQATGLRCVSSSLPTGDVATLNEITVISLCSSDEEEEEEEEDQEDRQEQEEEEEAGEKSEGEGEEEQCPASLRIVDENTEPEKFQRTGDLTAKSLIRKLTPTKLCAKPCTYPAGSTGNWLSANILTDDAENCANKYRGTVMVNACAHLSPILRPAP